MKAYQINIAPRTGGMGFVTVEKTRTTLLQSSQSLLDSIKIINAKIACGPECNISIHESQRARSRTLRKPGRLAFQKNDFYRPNLA
jgi:hypothetical protein